MVALSFTVSLSTPKETEQLAQLLAPHLRAGDILLLEGSIGAGKTYFCRSIIQSLLAVPEDIPSPTFTLVQTYEGPNFPIWHCDLYRLTHPDEAWELGLDEAFENALCLIEWPDRLGEDFHQDALVLNFEPRDDDTRLLTITSQSSRWCSLKEKLDA